jgi:hypothetical protein
VFVAGRCKATNLCRYCQTLYVLETVEMLLLDAAEYAPTLWVVLTAREHLTRAQCRDHLRQLRKAAKRRWPDVEWFVQVEFQRRGALHLNLLIKGVPVEDREQLHDLLSERWCARVDALPVAQWSGEVTDAGGVAKYLAKTLAHGLKSEQAPPIGWRGHRTSQTRGYFVRPASVMRDEARVSRRLKRELWRAFRAGHEGYDAELVAQQAAAAAAVASWELVTTSEYAPAGEPARDVVSVPEGEREAFLWNREARRAVEAWREYTRPPWERGLLPGVVADSEAMGAVLRPSAGAARPVGPPLGTTANNPVKALSGAPDPPDPPGSRGLVEGL